jgi:hypothetical protein
MTNNPQIILNYNKVSNPSLSADHEQLHYTKLRELFQTHQLPESSSELYETGT